MERIIQSSAREIVNVAATSTRYPNNLPVSRSIFIGRERERSEVKRLVVSTRLLTLTGPGGCGKTRLAVAVADSLLKLSRFEQGAWFVDLAGLDAPHFIPQAAATTLGVSEAHGRSLSATLADFLQHKKLLLILDNCEHLLAGCAELAQSLLEACPHLHILATSREPLNLPLELTWLVPSLALPELPYSAQATQLAKSDAIKLFVARASAALPGFALNQGNAFLVERICRRLDGIPLAIELAAARVKVLDLEQIVARVDDSLQLLTHGGRAAAPRHQTMRTALDWSYRLLLPREQALFRRLAVFAGSFTLDAAEAICADPESMDVTVQAADVLDVLSDLVDKSMALIAEREPGEAVRYRLLEPIQQYACDRLREAGEETIIRDRHLAYSIEFAERLEPKIKGENQLLWLERLDKEHDNLRAALAWSAQRINGSIGGLRLSKALQVFWERRSYWSEGRRWLQQAIATHDGRRELQSPLGDRCLAQAIVAEVWLAYAHGDFGGMRERLERGLILAQALDDRVTAGYALGLQAQLTSYAGNLSEALLLSEAGVANARRSGDHWMLAWVEYIHGMIVYRRDEAAARAALDESTRLFRDMGDRRAIAKCLNVMGYMAANAGQLDAARGLFEEALAIGNELEDKRLQFVESINLAHLAQLQGDVLRAAELYEQVLTQAQDWGQKDLSAGSLEGLGHIRLAQGDLDTASIRLRESLRLYREIGFEAPVPVVLAGLSRIAAEQGQAAEAARVMGAIDAYLTMKSARLDADQLAILERDNAAVRAALTPEEFAANFAAGHEWTLDQAGQAVTQLVQHRDKVIQVAPVGQQLRLRALGAARVFASERALTTWPYARVKELLFYLASYPARTKAQIGLALWPEASTRQLRNSLGTTLYHLRHALDDPQRIVFEDEVYRFNRALGYEFDVEVFEAHLAQASRAQAQTPDRAIALLQEAITLYQGDFVEDFLDGDWFLLRREELRRKYLDALLNLGQALFSQQDYARAAECYRRAIEKDEILEEAHRELMRCYARLGERGQALRHYQTFEQMMRDELGSAPAAEGVALYERLKRGEEV
jgi:predicted ATPase/DNA-binding SARP family transcriptional activator